MTIEIPPKPKTKRFHLWKNERGYHLECNPFKKKSDNVPLTIHLPVPTKHEAKLAVMNTVAGIRAKAKPFMKTALQFVGRVALILLVVELIKFGIVVIVAGAVAVTSTLVPVHNPAY